MDRSATNRPAFRWAGADDPRTGLVSAGDLHVGDVLVVPAEYGGCDKHGWAPASREPVTDVADKAAWPYHGRRYAVRITPNVEHWDRLSAVLAGTDEPSLDELLAALPVDDASVDENLEPTPEDGRARRNICTTLVRRTSGSSSCSPAATGGTARTAGSWPRAVGPRRGEPGRGLGCRRAGGTKRGRCGWPQPTCGSRRRTTRIWCCG